MGAPLGQPRETQREKLLPIQQGGWGARGVSTFCLQAFAIKEIAVSQGNSSPDEQ